MKLPLCRFRQIVELIQQRQIEAVRVQARMVEWQTKQIAAVIAGVSRLTNDGRRQMAAQIKAMTLIADDLEKVEPLTSEEQIADIVEHGSKTAADDPRNAAAIAWLQSALA